MILVVDLDGVAAAYRPERRLDALARTTGMTPARIDAGLFDSGLDTCAEHGHYTPEALVAEILDALDHTIDQAALVTAWSRCFEPNTILLNQITSLPAPTALFTNNGPMIDLCLAGPLHAIAEAFDHVICSWHLQATKPEPVAFDRAAERLGAEPAELLLLDDNLANVQAATTRGWQSTHITNLDEAVKLLRVLH